MSKKCLVTRLNGVTKNNSIPRFGFIKVKVEAVASPTKVTQGFLFNPTENTVITIDGDGYFTDESLSQNLGKTKSVNAGTLSPVYVSNGNFYVNIPKKVTTFIPKNNSSQNGTAEANNKSFDIDQLKFSTNIGFMEISCTGAYGDIASFANMTSLKDLYVSSAKGLYGNIASLNKCPITIFYAENTNLGGDIANLRNCSICVLQGSTGFYGNIENMPNIAHGYFQGNAIYGDVSKLNKASLLTGATCNWSWKNERSSDKTIIAFTDGNFGSDLDAMLINQAKCAAGSIKTIKVQGTRTNASDAAIAALQGKGYTVSIS